MSTAPLATARFNVLAIVGFILAFVVNIVGAILSIVALVQINRTGERGKGLAIAGIILGFVFFIIGLVVTFGVIGAAAQYAQTQQLSR